ncbi:MAG TPA: sugar ABC transporter permease [Kosmotogaceae bacterium]|nr:MAG: Binding-protein-dependent transport systems inner membrane component [Thermotogales bacterium 46_20]HAA85754.1 sugar ABC transporter permease [Kosmotogaceae bacterium]
MIKKALTLLIAILIAFWFLTPIVLIVLSSLTPSAEYYDPHRILPRSLTLNHLRSLFVTLGGWRATLNSIQVAGISIGISFLFGLPAAYALTRFVFRGKNSIRLAILLTRSFPVLIIGIPLLTLYMRIGISDTLLGVALAHTSMVLPFVVLISSSIIGGISVEYEEAGMIFGLSRFASFMRITMPLVLPGLAASAIFAFIMSWNEVFVAAILTVGNRTLPAHILNAAMTAPDYFKFAAGTIMAVPAMIFIFFTRKYLMSLWGISLK